MKTHLLAMLTAAVAVVAACTDYGAPTPANKQRAGKPSPDTQPLDPFWRNATVYFLMTDRFANGDRANDTSLGRKQDADLLRGFEGGDIQGVTEKIRAGYFSLLGVDAIWTTPLIENSHGSVVEKEWGKTYAYHGYWPRDWTKVDPNFGSEADLAAMIATAHERGIRVLADVIINHAGAPTPVDPVWPETWVRRGPTCDYKSYAGSVPCELSFTLQDILTESEAPVELPDFLIKAWRNEGRLDREMMELDVFFARTGYPRAPKYYIVKWLTDWVRDYGIDGFRVDTAKHVDPEIWAVLKREASLALKEWKASHPDAKIDDREFYMVGEVFNYGLSGFASAVDGGRAYDYGDRQVDFFDYGFDALSNMAFPTHAQASARILFNQYSDELEDGPFSGKGIINYITSHDDMNPFDPNRSMTFESAAKLMLAPGAVQIYYGDEVGRDLTIEGAKGDATLRSNMDWAQAETSTGAALLSHWRKLGKFRQAHLAIGAGRHSEISASAPYVFSRVLDEAREADRVVIAMDLVPGRAAIPVGDIWPEGAHVRDAYSGVAGVVKDGYVNLSNAGTLALLEEVHY
ncbi:MAG: alpha-amylase [Alphaproteobacteria bacterium]|nr:alpha-amylase [Alphaproteobacteria bacterium]